MCYRTTRRETEEQQQRLVYGEKQFVHNKYAMLRLGDKSIIALSHETRARLGLWLFLGLVQNKYRTTTLTGVRTFLHSQCSQM